MVSKFLGFTKLSDLGNVIGARSEENAGPRMTATVQNLSNGDLDSQAQNDPELAFLLDSAKKNREALMKRFSAGAVIVDCEFLTSGDE